MREEFSQGETGRHAGGGGGEGGGGGGVHVNAAQAYLFKGFPDVGALFFFGGLGQVCVGNAGHAGEYSTVGRKIVVDFFRKVIKMPVGPDSKRPRIDGKKEQK